MTDPLIQDSEFGGDIDPIEAQRTLMGFLGQTYSEISRYDNHLVSTNQFLAPKKQEFQRTAQQVMREVSGGIQSPPIAPQNPNIRHEMSTRPFVDTNTAPPIPSPVDPNQMEFSFDNSITAKSIDSKLNDIEKRIKKLDTILEKMLSYFESHDTENLKQE
jgi:hypothetical protein